MEEKGDNGMRCGPHSIGHGSHGPALSETPGTEPRHLNYVTFWAYFYGITWFGVFVYCCFMWNENLMLKF